MKFSLRWEWAGRSVLTNGKRPLDSGFQSLVGFRIPLAVFRISKSGIPDSIACIPDFKAQYSGFHEENSATSRNFQDFEIWILFTWGDLLVVVVLQNVLRIMVWRKCLVLK